MSDFDDSGLDAVPVRAAEAAAALSALRAPAEQAARSIDEAFGKAGTSLARSLAHAAADGKVSLAELARAVIDAVSAGSGSDGGGGGLVQALASVVSSAFSGARADGGAVSAGGAYLVGERGPEVFRPATGGSIEPAGAGGVSVTVNVQGGDVAGLARSDAQLAQALARAVSLGARRL
jgi:phage-related minor tail protein